ncbi:carbohydrate ABC transporter permease [Vibrio nigripulchritudo]|uniref:carbohydrate ABC transporter permease n=1 Tax=Vibrio nigripulchritudo TaxID=28173 RepID=UPI0003B244A9|nr:carbohydrate ABC transporter permease [Vibrio nigripulchritudo]CCN69373.1 putative ABC-type sugar transport system,permease component [Vibrio nigripulchritudo SFn118]
MIGRWIVFAIAASLMNFPVLVTLLTSFKSNAEIASNASLWIESWTLENYVQVFAISDRFDVIAYLMNSVVVASIGAVLPLLFCFPAAYVMVRKGYGTRILMPAVINLRAVPLIIFAIPLYMMYQPLHLLDSKLGLGLILAIVNLPLALMMSINAIHDIPTELDKASLVDGASPFTFLVNVAIPMSKPVLATTLIFGFITAWNEFLFGLMLTTKDAVPLTVGASFFFAAGGGGVQWGVAAAVMVIGTLPPTLLGLLIYRQIGQSVMGGAVKG